ncbi:hypothetical protein AB0M91_09455 [Micromonospora rifamycinica]|uniref:hypothetical protein n=1 Tax=Micromonospora rifamycinica TaxID=291594 RepID=UPI00342A1C6E
MHLIIRAWNRLIGRSSAHPPVPPGTGRAIQAQEQAAARDRLLAAAHRPDIVEYRSPRPAR